MKKILIILTICASFFIFQIALLFYDHHVTQRFFDFYPGEYSYEISVAGELSVDETEGFQINLMRLLNEYDLYCYQRLYLNHQGHPELIVWAYTEDSYYFDNVYLTKGKLTAINLGDYYYSNDGEKKGLIFNPIRNNSLKLYHLSDFSNQNKSIYIPYYLFTYADGAEQIYHAFAADLRALYPDLIISTARGHRHRVEVSLDRIHSIFAILTGMLVIIGLNIMIIKQTKKIQILKLEGYGNGYLYQKYVLGYAGLILLTSLTTNIIMYLLYIKTSLNNARLFLNLLFTPNIALIISIFGFSFISFIAILLINPNLALKGKNYLKKQKLLNYIVMLLLIIFATGTVIEGAGLIGRFSFMIINEKQYLTRIENLYYGWSIKPEYIAYSDIGIEGAKKMHEYLRAENNMIEVRMFEPIKIGRKEINIFEATKNYVRQYISEELATELTNMPYILIPENLAHLQEQISNIMRNYWYTRYGSYEEIIYPWQKFAVIDPWLFIHNGINISNAIIIVSDSFGVNLSTSTYFTYLGDKNEAQLFYDELCLHFDTIPESIIESVMSQYQTFKVMFVQYSLKNFLPIFLATILAIGANSYLIAVLNCEINEKRYAVLKCEGKTTFALIKDELITCFILLFLAEVILLYFVKMDFRELLTVIGIYFAFNVLILWCVTNYRMRNFAEKLR
ncbi:MAG: hypothetical protein FWE14_01375 [Lachnospiraceae bacterium]|nr:hypothetical protein [Lachnospiraceae bacterium]